MKINFLIALFLNLFILILSGNALADTTINGLWQDYYEEGDSVRISSGVKVTTRKEKVKAGSFLETGYRTWDLNKSVVTFKIRVSDWKNVSVLILYVGNGPDFNNAGSVDLRRKLINPPHNEWIEVTLPMSAWEIRGNVNWKKIDSILLATADAGLPGKKLVVEIVDITAAKVKPQSALVSISIDDGLSDTMTAFDIMKSRNMRGTVFIDQNKIGRARFISVKDIIKIQEAGWDVGGHNIGILTQYTDKDLASNIENNSAYLKSKGFNGSNLYALPNGAYNDKIRAEVSKHFEYVFNINGMANNLGHLNKINVNRHSIDKWTLLELAKKWVDQAKANGEWVIINFHTFSDGLVKDEDWTVSNFKALLDYISAQGLEIVPISEALKLQK